MSKIKFAKLWIFIIGFLTSVLCLIMSKSVDNAGWILAIFYSSISVFYAAKELINSKND